MPYSQAWKSEKRARVAGALGFVILASTLWAQATVVLAADAALLSVAPRIVTATDRDSFLIVIPPRSEAEIGADRDAAEKLRSDEKARLPETVDQEAGIRGKIELQKKEMEVLKTKIKMANEAKREVEKQALQEQMRAEETRLDLMEKRAKMRQAERELTAASIGAADALVDYYNAELELLSKRTAKPAEAAGVQDDAALERRLRYEMEVRELERKAQEAIISQVEKRQKVLQAEMDLLERRLELFELQNAVRKGKGK